MLDKKDQNIEAGYPDKNFNSQLPVNLESKEMFNYNNILSGVQNYMNLNYIANKLIGVECKWFRAVPQQRSKDVIFQEYTLSNVDSTPTCIKAVIPNGQIPDSKYNYDLNGLEYEVPLEINIDKRYWEDTFGEATGPQRNDIVYLIMPNKLYEVTSSTLMRGFMEQETTWRCNLIKYKPQASRRESEEFKNNLDNYIISEESLFGAEIDANINKLTSPVQLSPLNGTSKDFMKYFDPTLKVITEPLSIWGTIISDHYYDMSSSTSNDGVVYAGAADIVDDQTDRGLFAWFNLIDPNLKKYSVHSIRPATNSAISDKINFVIRLNTPEILDTSILNITRNSLVSLYADVISISDGNYYCHIPFEVLEYLNEISNIWYTMSDYTATIEPPVSILHPEGPDANSGLNNEIINRRFHRIKFADHTLINVFDENLEYNKWYGYVANLGSTWNIHNVMIWEPVSLYVQGGPKLKLFYTNNLDFNSKQTTITRSIIHKSYVKITNLRVFGVTVEEERQEEVLLSMFDKNGDQLFFADNALPIAKTPYIAQTR